MFTEDLINYVIQVMVFALMAFPSPPLEMNHFQNLTHTAHILNGVIK